MTFSKSKIAIIWVGLFAALAVAVVGAIVSGGSSELGENIALAGLGIAVLDVIVGFLFLRCPACGKVLTQVMKPWKSGCTCPRCETKIKYM